MSIFQISKKILNNIKKYVYYPNMFFDLNHMENMSILQENLHNCVIMNHNIEKSNIKQIDDKTIEIRVKLICDIVFDFEIITNSYIFDESMNQNDIRYTSELLCDDIIIHKNIENIKYENAFPISSTGCNYIKILLKYNDSINSDKLVIRCKYGLLPIDIKNKLKKLDIHEICKKRRNNDDWIIC